MPPNVLFVIFLTIVGTAAVPTIAWIRALRRIKHLEMTLLTHTTDGDEYAELRGLIQQVADQTSQLVDNQALLSRRLTDRIEPPLPGRADVERPVTPH